jgi:hypothetical protein
MTQATQALLDDLDELYAQRDLLNLQKQELIDSILTPEIRATVAEIEAEFADKAKTVNEYIQQAEAEVKTAVLEHGATIKSTHLQAVYAKGRVSWDTKTLDGLMIVIPQLSQARKEGAPSVSIRKVG